VPPLKNGGRMVSFLRHQAGSVAQRDAEVPDELSATLTQSGYFRVARPGTIAKGEKREQSHLPLADYPTI